jgi:hypothetical protein
LPSQLYEDYQLRKMCDCKVRDLGMTIWSQEPIIGLIVQFHSLLLSGTGLAMKICTVLDIVGIKKIDHSS